MSGIIMIMFATTFLHAVTTAPNPALVPKRSIEISFNPELSVDSEGNGLSDSPIQRENNVDEPITPVIDADVLCTQPSISTDLNNDTTNDIFRRQAVCPNNLQRHFPVTPVVGSPPTFQQHHPNPKIKPLESTETENPCFRIFQSTPAMPKLFYVSCGGPTQGGSVYNPHHVVNCVTGETFYFNLGGFSIMIQLLICF